MSRGSARNAGFTLVEVMISIGIMTVGSLGILAMHNAVTQGNRESRDMITALAVTQTWLERLERDALAWNAATSILYIDDSTTYLRPLALTTTSTAWMAPNSAADADGSNDAESPASDFFGRDTVVDTDVKYCVNYRLSWIRQGSSARVDVRTYWLREGFNPAPVHAEWEANPAFTAACNPAQADGWNLDPANPNAAPNINVVYASTVVRWTPRDDT